MTDYPRLLAALAEGQVKFIVVGGAAAIAHGSARLTFDLDVVYARDPENLRRLVTVLVPFHPYLRGAPAGLPFVWDERTLRNGLNFTLTTDLGDIDVLGEIVGGGGYEALLPSTTELEVHGLRCLCLSIVKLIEVKRAAGRPKDFEAIAELELILEEMEEK
jgi:hypothetical protein